MRGPGPLGPVATALLKEQMPIYKFLALGQLALTIAVTVMALLDVRTTVLAFGVITALSCVLVVLVPYTAKRYSSLGVSRSSSLRVMRSRLIDVTILSFVQAVFAISVAYSLLQVMTDSPYRVAVGFISCLLSAVCLAVVLDALREFESTVVRQR